MTNNEVKSLPFYQGLIKDLSKHHPASLTYETCRQLHNHYLMGLWDGKAITYEQFIELKIPALIF